MVLGAVEQSQHLYLFDLLLNSGKEQMGCHFSMLSPYAALLAQT